MSNTFLQGGENFSS